MLHERSLEYSYSEPTAGAKAVLGSTISLVGGMQAGLELEITVLADFGVTAVTSVPGTI